MAEIVKVQDTRRAFIDTLIELAEKDPRVVLIVPDVGFNYIEKFAEKFPDRFYNLGVTEQSAVCIAAGLALAGMRPYVYSMINFVAFRPFEMVRNLVGLHNAPVVLVGVKGSSSYKFLGFSHNMHFEDEDLYHLRPYMACHIPENPESVKYWIEQAHKSNAPAYIRL